MMSEISINEEILVILYKKVKGEDLSATEEIQYKKWLELSTDNHRLSERIQNDKLLLANIADRYSVDKSAAWNALKGRISPENRSVSTVRMISVFRRWWVAASILLILAAGAFYWFDTKRSELSDAISIPSDIQPGKEGAILTLADGTQVLLDSIKSGDVANKEGASIRITDGVLAYGQANEKVEISYNMLTTPQGRQYSIHLADGTRVWLNAGSMIRYPTVFTGEYRQVEIKGEVYFEVARNTQQPFRVQVNEKTTIEVLGTHFNVSAYDNEQAILTTLIEGSVKVAGVVITSGQQAKTTGDDTRVINNVDLEKVLAWKNGLFHFDGASLEEMMRQIERWYDIEVEYQGSIPVKQFEGKMTRGITLKQLRVTLEEMGVRTQLYGRKLIVFN